MLEEQNVFYSFERENQFQIKFTYFGYLITRNLTFEREVFVNSLADMHKLLSIWNSKDITTWKYYL